MGLEDFKQSRHYILGKHLGALQATHLPVGDWEFVRNQNGEICISTAKSQHGISEYQYFEVTPKGNPAGVKRQVHFTALVSDSAITILFDADGRLKRYAVFGVFTRADNNGNIETIVSDKQDIVTNGIAKAIAHYYRDKI